jgi:outer membrane protein OmpA-like peptidoglycan-associated protein
MKHASSKYLLAAAVAGLVLTGCAADDPNRSAKTGAVIGAVLGGVAGKQVSDARGAPIVGAVVGAIAGGAVGNYMDKQRAELERQLKAEADRKELQITQLSDNAIKIGIASDASFSTGSAQLSQQALTTFAKIAGVIKDYDKTVVHIVGHTDTVGTAQFNQGLSERRAASVSSYIGGQGVPGSRIREEGRGERELLVRTGDGVADARNRRVDIVIKPVVEGQESQAWAPPPYLGG